MQLTLSLAEFDLTEPNSPLWDNLNHEPQQAALEKLSRLIAQAALITDPDNEDHHD